MNDPIERDLAEIEALLSQLEPGDLIHAEPPEQIWAGIEAALAEDRHDGAPVVSIHSWRRGHRRTWLAVAAATVLVIGASVAVLARRGSGDTLLATATLAWDPAFDPAGATAAAQAELVEHDGSYQIRLSDTELPDPAAEQADLELWLIAVDASGTPADIAPISLVDGSEPGTYQVPDGVDPTVNTIVDISIEPRDGDQHHSGRSILRGALADV